MPHFRLIIVPVRDGVFFLSIVTGVGWVSVVFFLEVLLFFRGNSFEAFIINRCLCQLFFFSTLVELKLPRFLFWNSMNLDHLSLILLTLAARVF